MTQQNLSEEFRELVKSGLPIATLTDCYAAKLSAAARKEYGKNVVAGVALGVCAITLSRWTVAGRLCPIGEQLQSTIGRIAGTMIEQKKTAAESFTVFEAGLAEAAMESTNGNKKAAGRVLGIHRSVVARILGGTAVKLKFGARRSA